MGNNTFSVNPSSRFCVILLTIKRSLLPYNVYSIFHECLSLPPLHTSVCSIKPVKPSVLHSAGETKNDHWRSLGRNISTSRREKPSGFHCFIPLHFFLLHCSVRVIIFFALNLLLPAVWYYSWDLDRGQTAGGFLRSFCRTWVPVS